VHLEFDFRFFFTLLMIVVPAAIAGPEFLRIYRTVRLGKSENLYGNLFERALLFVRNWIFQQKMFKDFWPGFAHGVIFFGFIVVTIGSFEHLIEGLLHGFTFAWLFGPLYGPLSWAQDLLVCLICVAVVYFLARRLFFNPKRMSKDPRHRRDGLIVLAFTGGHMVASLFAFGFFALAKDPHHAMDWRPFSQAFSNILGLFVQDPVLATKLGWIWWGIHIGTVGGFLMYIPYSKHLHIMAAAPNIFFARLKPKGALSLINFADESQTNFGVAKLNEFSWKDVLDAYTCTACGRCNEFCPTATTDKPLMPMKLIDDIKRYANNQGPLLLKDKQASPSQALVSEESGLSYETIWACTTCRACVEACPVMIEHVDKIVDMRRAMVLMEGKMPEELQLTLKNWETQSNPWGMAPDARDEWARAFQIPRLADKPQAEYLFYVGCAGSFNDRNKKITTAFAKILLKAGVDFAILGKEELCNGETARRAGNEYLAKTMIDANIEVLKRYNVKKILATCPHCFNTLKNEYPDFGFKAEEVIHHTEFIDRLIQSKKISVETNPESMKVVFHDSCYLGRYNDVYDAPRSALRSVGAEVVEMPRTKSKGLCCGAGGARMWMEEKIGKRINIERAEEALATEPQVIAAGCPFCQVMLNDGVTAKGQGDKVRVLDVAEIVAERVKL
jgi:Fe-S oxidoreductase